MTSSTSLIIITNQQENEKISPKNKKNKQYNETTSNPNNIVDT